MAEILREWVMGITVVSVLAALADALTEKSASRPVVRMIATLALLAAALWPLKQLDLGRAGRGLDGLTAAYAQSAQAGQQKSADLTLEVGGDQLAAYVENRARALGLVCTAQVTLNGAHTPESVTLRFGTPPGDTKKQALAELLQAELGVAAGDIRFIAGEDGTT